MNRRSRSATRRRGRRRRSHWRSLLFLAFFVLAQPAHAASEQDLLGAIVDGREVATLLAVRREGRYWLPLDEVAKISGIQPGSPAGEVGTGRSIKTPLGDTTIPASRLHAEDGVTYVDEDYLRQSLNFRLDHDRRLGTLVIVPPWRGSGRSRASAAPAAQPVPEVLPSAWGLTSLHGQVSFEQIGRSDIAYRNTLRATGFAWDGVWQAVYEDDLVGNRQLRDFAWMRQVDDHNLVQIGHQTIALHPLLSQELTGVQWGWSSRAISKSPQSFYPGSLLQRWGTSQRSFTGRGPVGGFAELWIDDRLVERRDIGLDGTYAFRDVPLGGRQARVEVKLFDSRDPRTPVSVVKQAMDLSELLLDAGQSTALLSAGVAGNAFERLIGTEGGATVGSATASALYRLGISNDLTLEAGTVVGETSQVVMAGVVTRLAPRTYANVAASVDATGRYGYDTGLAASGDKWRLTLDAYRSLDTGAGAVTSCATNLVGNTCQEVRHAEMLQLAYLPERPLELGLIARSDDHASFVLPYFEWHPNAEFSTRLRPDNYGHFRSDSVWRASPLDTFRAVAAHDAATVSYTREFRDSDVRLTLSGGYDFTADEIEGLVAISGRRLAHLDLDWRFAVVGSPSGIGFETSLRRKLGPGIYGFLDASSGHQHRSTTESLFGSREDLRLRVGIRFDVGMANDGHIVEASAGGVRPDVGALSGVVAPAARGGNDLSGIPILVDGQIAGRTAADGSFFIPDVQRGVRTVEFEPEKLPIEHVANKRSFVAKVSPGAVTSMTFETQILYGVSGRVLAAAGGPVADALVEILDKGGKVVAHTSTDGFGYYRIDDLASGQYEVRALRRLGGATARRTFAIGRDFAQDVVVTLPAK